MRRTRDPMRLIDSTDSYSGVVDSIKSLLHPTSSKRFQMIDDSIQNCYKPDITDLKSDRDTIRHLVLATRSKRMKILGDLKKELIIKENYGREVHDTNSICPPYLDTVSRLSTLDPEVEHLTRKQENLLRKYLHYVETTRRLRGHLDDINEDLENFEYLVKSQAVAELTTYRGFNDWGETMYNYINNYATGLGGLSIAGAGLVYSTIFNHQDDTKDPIGLMSLTFPLFTVGFLIPGFVYIAVCWARNLPRSLTFASQRFWTAALVLALSVATVVVIGAIVIVNITILRIEKNKKWSLARISGVFSLIFSGLVIAIALLAVFVACFSRRMRTTVKEHWSRIQSKEHNALNTYNHV